jgi:SRSO17 transposase
MGRTITLELDVEVVERLSEYALAFRPLFLRSNQFKQVRVYLHGLLLDGERKSIEPLSRRVPGGKQRAQAADGPTFPEGASPGEARHGA